MAEAIRISVGAGRGTQSVIYSDQQGMFEVGGLAPGFYTLEAIFEGRRNLEGATERVEVLPGATTPVTVYLKEKVVSAASKPGSLVVSAGELDERVPAAARKEFERASRLAREGKTQEAIASMRKAIATHPGYVGAHNDLGTYLFSLGRLDEAAEELRLAARLNPKAFNPQLNLGIVFVAQHKFADAVEVLERALSIDGASASAHLFAGLAYLGIGESGRAEKELRAAYELGGKLFATAQYHLGRLYMEQGERSLALRAFEAYLLDAPEAANAAEVRRMIAMLR